MTNTIKFKKSELQPGQIHVYRSTNPSRLDFPAFGDSPAYSLYCNGYMGVMIQYREGEEEIDVVVTELQDA